MSDRLGFWSVPFSTLLLLLSSAKLATGSGTHLESDWVSVVSNSSRGRPWGNLEPYVSVGVLSTLGFSFCFASLLAPPPLSRFGRSPPAGREDFSACTVPQYFYPLVGSRKVAQGLMALPWLFLVPSGACRPIPGRPPPPGPPVFVPGVAPAPLDHPGYFPGGLPPPRTSPVFPGWGSRPLGPPPGIPIAENMSKINARQTPAKEVNAWPRT